jgi:hypothetical protein
MRSYAPISNQRIQYTTRSVPALHSLPWICLDSQEFSLWGNPRIQPPNPNLLKIPLIRLITFEVLIALFYLANPLFRVSKDPLID